MSYYFMDGIDKKGPYTKEEIIKRNLPKDTLIIKEGMISWTKIGDHSDFNDNIEILSKEEKSIKTDKPEIHKAKIKIPAFLFLLIGVIISVIVSYFFTDFQRKKDLEEFNKKIDATMSGKNNISDYSFGSTYGKLYKVYVSDEFPGTKSARTEKRVLAYNFGTKTEDSEQEMKTWDLFSSLYEYYESEPYTGFTVYKLSRINDRFKLTYSWSGDMAYKIPEKRFIQGYSSEYFSSPGYEVSNYRPSISKCYEDAAKFLTVEDADNSYLAGSYNTINGFPSLNSDFHEIQQSFPKYYYFADTIFVNHSMGEKRGYVIDYNKITPQTSRTDSRVFDNKSVVWYKSYTNSYYVVEKEKVFMKKTSIYSGIGIFISCLIFFYVRYKNRIEIK